LLKEIKLTKTTIFTIILGLNYFPLVFLPSINRISGNIGGLPIVWVYMILWVLYSFILLVVAYSIDRRFG